MSVLDDKLDARARVQLAIGELTSELELLLRLAAPLTPKQQQELAEAGCKVRSQSGNIVVGRTQCDRLSRLADCSFVERIEVARQLHQEGGRPPT
jgi:hypothetical protein